MLRINEAQALLHAALVDELLNGVGDVVVIAPVRGFKPEMFSQAFHDRAVYWTRTETATFDAAPSQSQAGSNLGLPDATTNDLHVCTGAPRWETRSTTRKSLRHVSGVTSQRT